jgi:hypothetical protein
MRKVLASLVALCLVLTCASAASADVKSTHKTQTKFEGTLGRMMNLFGGKGAKEGVINSVAIKGNRQLTMTDTSGELVDLDAERIYIIDVKSKSYKVQTFEEYRKQIEEAQAKAREGASRSREDAVEKKGNPADPQFEMDLDVKKTGQQKVINGETCQQFIMTLSMRPKGKTLEQGGGLVLTTDSWLGPKNPAMQEQVAFQLRFVKKLFGTDAATYARDLMSEMAMVPGMQEGMARMQKEAAKMDGTAWLTVMRIESVATAEQAQARANSDKQGGGGLGGLAGGVGGMFGRKKKAEDQPTAGPPTGGPSTRSTVMTSTTELLGINTTVSGQDVDIPAGFKQK